MGAVKHLVAGAGIGAGQQPQQLIRSGAADDPGGIKPIEPRQTVPQGRGMAVRISMHLGGGVPVGFHGARAGTQSAFVGGQTDQPIDAGSMRLAADIWRNIEDSGTGGRSRHGTVLS